MRNKYSDKFKKDMYVLAIDNSLNDLLKIARRKYHYDITKKQLSSYLSKRKIRYKDYDFSKVRDMSTKIKIGTEYVKPDGMTLVKVAKDKWEYKQRLIYSKYHNIELSDDDYIIFLDQDRTNFDINNLKKISRRQSSVVANQKLFFNNKELTETGIMVADLIIKAKSKKEKHKNIINKKTI